jgi:hypothetical protein
MTGEPFIEMPDKPACIIPSRTSNVMSS